MKNPVVVNVNLSTSGCHLGGAAIASEYHSRYMAEYFPVQLWRMWDGDEEFEIGALTVRNFESKTSFPALERFMPRRVRSCFLDSQILPNVLSLNPKIIHLHNPIPSLAFENLTRQASRAGIKVVASTHGFFEVMHPNYNLTFYEQWFWNKTVTNPIQRALDHMDAVFALYPDEQQMLQHQGVPAHKIHLIPNGVNPFFLDSPSPTDVDQVCEKFGLNSDKPMLLFIGNHTANKGLNTVMMVASQLSVPVTVVVGGRLLTADEPQQWMEKSPPQRSVDVVFTDYLSLAEQRALYHLSTLLLFPSISDTLPLTIIEAMASGLPVVAYDVGGIAYQLVDNAGVVIQQGAFADYLRAVESLLESQEQRAVIAKNAKVRQQNIFSWESAAQKTISVYKTLLS